MTQSLAPEPWMEDAVCARYPEADLWHPEAGEGREHKSCMAKRLCLRCPVRAECLTYAKQFPETRDYGIWGGTTPLERRQMRRLSVAEVLEAMDWQATHDCTASECSVADQRWHRRVARGLGRAREVA
jgi:WhiB family redox-sensing transcriptional regulator